MYLLHKIESRLDHWHAWLVTLVLFGTSTEHGESSLNLVGIFDVL